MFARLSRPTNPSDDGRLNAPPELAGHRSTKATGTQSHGQHSLTISELHYSFALFLFSFSGPTTQNGRGATKWGKAKMARRQTETSYLRPFAEFDRVWPAAGLTLALIATVRPPRLRRY